MFAKAMFPTAELVTQTLATTTLATQVLNHKDRHINIVGVPGAGKTTLVGDIARQAPQLRFLYVSFGSENSKSAKTNMPDNVYCSSLHAFSRQLLNVSSSRLRNSLSMSDYRVALKQLNTPLTDIKLLDAFQVLNSLFCASGIAFNHLPDVYLRNKKQFPVMNNDELSQLLITYRDYWIALWQTNCSLPVTHGMYLKQYSMVATTLPFDYLVIDEGQDLNDAMFAAILRMIFCSPSIKSITLLDPVQQIYSFLGASHKASMLEFQFKLDETHRFGKNLCGLVNKFMEAQHGIHYYTPIWSKSSKTEIHDNAGLPELIEKIKSGFKPTFISRYNHTLWHILQKLAMAGITCSINGKDSDELQSLVALHNLYLGKKVTSHGLNNYTYDHYKKMAQANNNTNTLTACRFVEKLGKDGATTFKLLLEHLVPTKQAQVLLTTVHQAKGLEFNHVVMANDFPDCIDQKRNSFIEIEREDAHLIYTAITRTKRSIYLPKNWLSLNRK